MNPHMDLDSKPALSRMLRQLLERVYVTDLSALNLALSELIISTSS